jgi:protein-disulfide isomerase
MPSAFLGMASLFNGRTGIACIKSFLTNMAIKTKSGDIILSKNVWIGPSDAPVSLVEFGDYQSEDCAKAHEIVNRLLTAFEGKLKFNFRHFPLSRVHQSAMKAAEAAVAAAQEGKFWEMHDILFKNRRQLGTISLKSYARQIGITDKRFLDNLMNSTYSWQVRDDLLEGLQRGVREVPSYFINGIIYTGDPGFEHLSRKIREEYQE